MSLQLSDQRPPLTLAIALAKEGEEPCLSQWEGELSKMVAEVSRKFHGALTAGNIRQGLQTSVGLVSIGLMVETEGRHDAALFFDALRRLGIRGASRKAVDLIKECDSLPETGFLDAGDVGLGTSTQALLLQCAANGYAYLMKRLTDRRINAREILLARWLLVHSSVGRVIQRNREGTVGEVAIAEDVISYVLLREVGIPEIKCDMEQTVVLPPRKWTEAFERYSAFVEKVPADLKPALFFKGVSWFDRVIQSTSEVKKAPAKKSAAKAKPAAEPKKKKTTTSAKARPAAAKKGKS